MKKRVFSGIQPTGDIHLGNYLGAIRNWVARQDEFENIFCVVDLHAITLPQNPEILRQKSSELCAMLLACGIDPQKSTLFIQSCVSEHTKLAWLLTCQTPLGQLQQMTQYKDKAAKQKSVPSGLLCYPVLMAADILLYQTDFVPVGEDQRQHIELTRNLAENFNRDFGETFKMPSALIEKAGAKIMGLDDPSKKMSKSSSDRPNHSIALLDPPELIEKKIKKATTDSDGIVAFDPARAGVFNLLSIYECLSGFSREAIQSEFENKGYGELKKRVAEVIISTLEPIQREYKRLLGESGYLDEILQKSAQNAKQIAKHTYKTAAEKMGLCG